MNTDNRLAKGYLGPTSRFKPESIVYNDGEFAIAEGQWYEPGCEPTPATSCRWHATHPGYPQSRGYPQWMCLPDEVAKMLRLGNLAKKMIRAAA